jgi:hypothetical protein
MKVFSKLLFLLLKNSRDGENTSLVLFLSLDIMGMISKVYKRDCGYFISPTPLGYEQPFFEHHQHPSLIYLAM